MVVVSGLMIIAGLRWLPTVSSTVDCVLALILTVVGCFALLIALTVLADVWSCW